MEGAENRKRSLVIAVDESEDARRACRWARQELYRPGDEVHILHVVPRLQHATMYGAPPIDFLPTQDAAAYENLIHNSEAYIAQHFVSEFEGLQVEPVVHIIRSEVDTDSIGHVICKRADELNAVAVVMAKHSKGKLKEFFMGSVTNYCTHHSHRPVIVVH